MDNYLAADILSTISHNLTVGATLLECIECEATALSPEARQQLTTLHVGLSMALDALQTGALNEWVEGAVLDPDYFTN